MKRALTNLLGIIATTALTAGILLMPQEQEPEGEQSAAFYQPGTLGASGVYAVA